MEKNNTTVTDTKPLSSMVLKALPQILLLGAVGALVISKGWRPKEYEVDVFGFLKVKGDFPGQSASSVDGGYTDAGQRPIPPVLDLEQTAARIQGTMIAESTNRPAMVGIDAGSFWMGSHPQERGECQSCQNEILHRVRIGYSFYVAESEITQAQFESVLGDKPMTDNYKDPRKPVGNVSFYDALKYCNQLSVLESLESCYNDIDNGGRWEKLEECRGYRLPTEAEWEYVARAGEWTLYAGSDDPDQVAWYNRGEDDGPEPVKTKQPNHWKLYDLSGNVAEWVWDGYGPYIMKEPEVVNPLRMDSTSPNAALTVLRGGAWYDRAFRVRAANRQTYEPEKVAAGHGFRIVRSNF